MISRTDPMITVTHLLEAVYKVIEVFIAHVNQIHFSHWDRYLGMMTAMTQVLK